VKLLTAITDRGGQVGKVRPTTVSSLLRNRIIRSDLIA
jgi:hypothetical protein